MVFKIWFVEFNHENLNESIIDEQSVSVIFFFFFLGKVLPIFAGRCLNSVISDAPEFSVHQSHRLILIRLLF